MEDVTMETTGGRWRRLFICAAAMKNMMMRPPTERMELIEEVRVSVKIFLVFGEP